MLLARVLLQEGELSGALGLAVSALATRASFSGVGAGSSGGCGGGASRLSPLWWLSARAFFARVLFLQGQMDPCLEQCRALAAEAAEVKCSTFSLAARELELRCGLVTASANNGSGGTDQAVDAADVADTLAFATDASACIAGTLSRAQYQVTAARVLCARGAMSEAGVLLTEAAAELRAVIVAKNLSSLDPVSANESSTGTAQSKTADFADGNTMRVHRRRPNAYHPALLALASVETARAELMATTGDRNAVLGAVATGLQVRCLLSCFSFVGRE